jgi:superfamily II DNA or RNA helicase
MRYFVHDTLYGEDSPNLPHRHDVLDVADAWNYHDGHHRFIPMTESYRRNPKGDAIPIPLVTPTPVWEDWQLRVRTLLGDFNRRIFWTPQGVRWRKISAKTLEFSTPRSRDYAYSYRISLNSEAKYTGKLATSSSGSGHRYFSYHITEDYLADENVEIMHAVFQLLFMGDEDLLPFLFGGSKVLTIPQQRVFEGFIESYERGDKKGAIVLPTGIGKTVLAARVVVRTRPERLLFISDRNFILQQAIATIKDQAANAMDSWVIPNSEIGHFYGQHATTAEKRRELQKKYVFANPQSFNTLLPRRIPGEIAERRWEGFKKWIKEDAFDLIIVDEAHHIKANTWHNIIQYFKPKYLLGLTATPYRSDSKEPLRALDYNILYKAADWEKSLGIETLTLLNAVKLGYLVFPTFRQLEEELVAAPGTAKDSYIVSKKDLSKARQRAKKIIDRYEQDAPGKQAVVFCSNADEAIRLEAAFNEAGIASDHLLGVTTGPPDKEVLISRLQMTSDQKKAKPKAGGKVIVRKRSGLTYDVISGAAAVLAAKKSKKTTIMVQDERRVDHKGCCRDTPRNTHRTDKLNAFRDRRIQALFVVDVLNEGVDIKNIEVVLWLRETKGVVRLLQQLGRGLRLDVGKRSLLVLDFMKNIEKVQEYLSGGFKATGWNKKEGKKKKIVEIEIAPEDKEIIELLESQGKIIVGDDIELFPMSRGGGDEPSEESLSPLIEYKAAAISMPKPTPAQKTSMARAHKFIAKTKDHIVALATVPDEDGLVLSAAEISAKIGWDLYVVAEILYTEGVTQRPPFVHPEQEKIETAYSISSQNQIIDNHLISTEKTRIRNILKAGKKAIGSRELFGGKNKCRIEGCSLDGIYRGMCELHYLFTWQEIREARVFEDDLVVRFLLEPRPTFEDIFEEDPEDEDELVKPKVATKKTTKKKAKKKIAKKKSVIKKKKKKAIKKKVTKKATKKKKITKKKKKITKKPTTKKKKKKKTSRKKKPRRWRRR